MAKQGQLPPSERARNIIREHAEEGPTAVKNRIDEEICLGYYSYSHVANLLSKLKKEKRVERNV